MHRIKLLRRAVSTASHSGPKTARTLRPAVALPEEAPINQRPSAVNSHFGHCLSSNRPFQLPSITYRRFSSVNTNKGEEVYQQALEALKQVDLLQEEKEKQKADELHRAIERAETKEKEHANNPKAKNLKGVTVVKTVIKQTRKERKNLKQEESQWEERAHALLTEAATTHGHPQALILLGNGALQHANRLWADMDDSSDEKAAEAEKSVRQALDYYEKAGANGSAEGWFNIGQLLWTGYPAVEEEEATSTELILSPDEGASIEAFRKAIALGDPDAMYFVGVQQLSKEAPIRTVLEEGLELIQSAGKMGHGPARYYLALLHLNGNEGIGVEPCAPSEFVDYLNAATDAGDADALFLRGHSYHDGDNGYPLDHTKALKDFLVASEAGNADAAVSAGAMLHQGRPGVPQNQVSAFELYQTAGEMGSVEGWRNVVACYALGEGVPRSEATAKYIAKTMLNE